MSDPSQLYEFVLNRLNVGILMVDRELEIALWNGFMETHTGRPASEVVGRNLFECFPDLPQTWLKKKIEGVFLVRSYSFTNWHDRPYLIRMTPDRPISGGVDFMLQDCTFFPVPSADGSVEHVCISIVDATETALTEERLESAFREIEVLSTTDGLTGLLNRRTLEERLEVEVQRARRYDTELSVALFDIDNFKRVNDEHGHACGDSVLRLMSQRVEEILRTTDIVARYGGEEFVIIMPVTGIAGAYETAERVRVSLADCTFPFEEHGVSITISVGVAQLASMTTSPDDLLKNADVALYRAKERGRNRVVVFDGDSWDD
jgi:diguanylate cyclase (GGDEF)-like protein